jgi:hypothetical protein
MGHSAGAASVMYHMTSPRTTGIPSMQLTETSDDSYASYPCAVRSDAIFVKSYLSAEELYLMGHKAL